MRHSRTVTLQTISHNPLKHFRMALISLELTTVSQTGTRCQVYLSAETHPSFRIYCQEWNYHKYLRCLRTKFPGEPSWILALALADLPILISNIHMLGNHKQARNGLFTFQLWVIKLHKWSPHVCLGSRRDSYGTHAQKIEETSFHQSFPKIDRTKQRFFDGILKPCFPVHWNDK